MYVGELESLADSMREQTSTRNKQVDDGLYKLALDPTKSLGPPPKEAPVPYFNFAPLKNALQRLQDAAKAYDKALAAGGRPSRTINELLYTSERLMTRDQGLSGRPWYKHHIYAPGFYTGYGVKTIPGVREAIEQRDYAAVPEQVEIAAGVLQRVAERIESLAGMMGN